MPTRLTMSSGRWKRSCLTVWNTSTSCSSFNRSQIQLTVTKRPLCVTPSLHAYVNNTLCPTDGHRQATLCHSVPARIRQQHFMSNWRSQTGRSVSLRLCMHTSTTLTVTNGTEWHRAACLWPSVGHKVLFRRWVFPANHLAMVLTKQTFGNMLDLAVTNLSVSWMWQALKRCLSADCY